MNDTPAPGHPPRRIGMVLPLLLLALLVLGGCASTGANSSSGGSRDEITREQLVERPGATAYEAIRRHRGLWLRPRGGSQNEIAVYVNNQRNGTGVDVLRSFRAGELARIEYFDVRQATARWGTGHSAGAIVLVLL